MARPVAASAFDAFDALPDPAAILSADGALVRANAAFRAAFRHWIGPKRPPWGRMEPPAFVNGERRFDAPAPDGRRFEWRERILPDGARFAVAREITRYAHASEQALRAKTTLFATMTHELRTPLNGILGMAELLEASKLEPNERTYVDAIKQSGALLLDLITDVLDYARLDAGPVALETAEFDPESVLQDVAELLSPRAHAKGLELVVVVHGQTPTSVRGDDGKLRQILFNLAGNAIKFTESGGVSIEVSPRAKERLRFAVRDTGPGVAPDKQRLIFDEFVQADPGVARRYGGAGLGLAVVKRLAHAMGGEAGLSSRPGEGAVFWVDLPLPATAATPKAQPLSNVGVALLTTSPLRRRALEVALTTMGARTSELAHADVAIVDGDGGQIAQASQAKARVALVRQERRDAIERCRAEGIAHYVLTPFRRRVLAERLLLALREASHGAAAADRAPAFAGLRVLVGEDNPVNALLVRTMLTRAGCLVTIAQDGEETVSAAAAAAFDLIFVDIRMPRMDGLEAAARIRAGAGPSAAAPIVALTADASQQDRAAALAAGMDEFLTKPIDADRLLAVVARFTDREKPFSLSL
jgi:signal transduction histidine kinase/CheY-like chemotaxis protein